MLTFHGKEQLKEQRIVQVRAHRLADQLMKGIYWQDGKGCAVGCTIHSSEHDAYETELGIPVELAWLEDSIFELLPNEQAMTWPERFLEAIPVAVDLRATHINKRFLFALLADEKRGLIPRIKDGKLKDEAIEIAHLLKAGIAEAQPRQAPQRIAYLADLADLADRADLADLADRADRAYLAGLAYLAYRAYRADRADRADLAYLAGLADLADRAYLADLAYLADRAYLAGLAEILLEVLAVSAPSTSSLQPIGAKG